MTSIATAAHAQQIDSFGDSDVLHDGVRAISPPERGQVQIKVAATTVNPADLLTRSGKVLPSENAQFPMVLGWDAAGTIEQLGDGVEGWQVGDRVAAMSFQPLDQNGTYTELMNLNADLLAQVPEGLDLDHAATIPLAGLTALQLLRSVKPRAEGSLLINGPAGAVGRFVVQLAHRAGLHVVGVATLEDRDEVLALGAHAIVDRGEFAPAVHALYPGGVDAAIDVVGGKAMRAALASVRDGGACITSFYDYDDPTNTLQSERGIRTEQFVVRSDAADLASLLDAAGRGELTTAIAGTYPLADASEAHRRLEKGGLHGKLVLHP
jgi:NADPH2:quinone reductase